MKDEVLVDRPRRLDGAVQVIRFNRPEKKNAFTREMYAAMTHALVAGDEDDGVRVHVFLGCAGVFSAGNDMHDFADHAADGTLADEVLGFLRALATSAKPLIAGVDGLAIGIGTTMHFHCDLTFATPRSEFRTPFVDLALVPEAGSSLLAPRVMGYQRAFALLGAGAAFSAEAARDAGLICNLVEENRLEEEVFEAALALARKPPQALKLTRELLRGASRAEIVERIDLEARQFGEQLRSAEARQAVAAFLNRRK